MRLIFAAAFSLALAAPVAAAEHWRYEGGATPIAWFDTDAAQFQFACRGGVLTMGYWVRNPDKQVAAAASISLAITPDAAKGSAVTQSSGTNFAQDMPLVHLDGSSVIVRGPVARQWAQIAQNARDTMRVAFVRTKGHGAFDALDAHVFPAKGSKTMIGKVLEKCG
jgi:opacity protein-like surface antigen